MSEIVIQAENISKLYRLGTISTNSMRQEMFYWWQKNVLKKENPFFQSGPDEDQEVTRENDNYIWALRNINFEVKRGEVWGIIGSNGSGKSTFLKILSKIIKPTNGRIRGRGKISSLLEVGAGFHEDLTGRENIYISGYMLGMSKSEISKKFDEIIAFSGVEKFLDTPVKRYSSGMYVRLAFAVAAHLEPDILVVDEVLAVGDADFQKKCLGKMKEDSQKEGRTVIFVSHNLQAIEGLCNRSIWLDKGVMKGSGDSKAVVNKYLGAYQQLVLKTTFPSVKEAAGNDKIKVLSIELIPDLVHLSDPIDIRTPLTIKFRFYNFENNIILTTDLLLFNLSGECIFDLPSVPAVYGEGFIEGECKIPGKFLNDGSYYFSLYFVKDTSIPLFTLEECLRFDVADYRENMNWYEKFWGYVRPDFPITLKVATQIPDLVSV